MLEFKISTNTVLIEGTLRIQSNTYLSANRIEVATTGQLLVGTASDPVSDVSIYLSHQMGYNHVTGSGSDTDAGQLMSYGITKMNGTAKTSWTLLNDDCDQCSTLSVNECSGWSICDRLAIALPGNGTISAVSESSNGCTTLNTAATKVYLQSGGSSMNRFGRESMRHPHRLQIRVLILRQIQHQVPTQKMLFEVRKPVIFVRNLACFHLSFREHFGSSRFTTLIPFAASSFILL